MMRRERAHYCHTYSWHERSGVVYEIIIRGGPPLDLTASSPAISLDSLPAATVLYKEISDPDEMDQLSERLRTLGITPLEVRASSQHCEFWIEGRLGRSTLRSLQWTSRFEPERTVLRVRGAQRELRMILERLAQSGIQIDSCVRASAA